MFLWAVGNPVREGPVLAEGGEEKEEAFQCCKATFLPAPRKGEKFITGTLLTKEPPP